MRELNRGLFVLEVIAMIAITGAIVAADETMDLVVLHNNNAYGTQGIYSYKYNAGTGQYDKSTERQFIDLSSFADGSIQDITLGPDGNLYVVTPTVVKRYSGTTGAFIDDYITGLSDCRNIVFGPSGKAYVDNFQGATYQVPIYERQNDGSLTLYATSPGYNANYRMAWGPDLSGDGVAELYVATNRWGYGVFRFADGTYYEYAHPSNGVYEAFDWGPDTTGDGVPEVFATSQYVTDLPITYHNGATGVLIGNFSTGNIGRYCRDMKWKDGKLYMAANSHGDVRIYNTGGTLDYALWVKESWVLSGKAYALEFLPSIPPPPTPTIDYSDEIVIDGNLDDWADAAWKPFDKTYDGTPSDIVKNESAWAVRWGAGGAKVYMALKVRDTAHRFKDSYIYWNIRDAVELYLHTTGSGHDYENTQEDAQHWSIGIKDSDRNAVWATIGDPSSYGGVDYVPSPDELLAAGHEDGEWLYYEAALTPFEYFGGLIGAPETSGVSLLHENDLIGNDALAVGHNGAAYTGMVSSGHNEGGWYANYTLFAIHKLIRAGVKGTITLQDFGASTLGVVATIVITDASLVSETHNLVLDGSGAYSFKTALRGSCAAVASAAGYRPQSRPVVVDTNGNGSVSFTLVKQSVIPPTVGANNRAVLDHVMASASYEYAWVLWGEVSNRTAGAFDIDDGSGVIIHVIGTNTVANGNHVAVKGTLDAATKTLTSQGITNYSP